MRGVKGLKRVARLKQLAQSSRAISTNQNKSPIIRRHIGDTPSSETPELGIDQGRKKSPNA